MLFLPVFILQSCFRAGHSPSISVANCDDAYLKLLLVKSLIVHGSVVPDVNCLLFPNALARGQRMSKQQLRFVISR